MMHGRNIVALSAAFAAACALALWMVGARPPRERESREARGGPREAAAPEVPRVLWRVPVGPRACPPCALADGWVVADGAGGVAKVSSAGFVLWRAGFSNIVFAGAAALGDGRVALAAEDGAVIALAVDSGAEVWRRQTDARFQHAPVAGQLSGGAVLWLVSQEDGRLFCLRAADGEVVWTSEETNRCDGEPAAWDDRIAYGNCDGAVYVFRATDGKQVGKVDVGEEDQMAGGLLPLGGGRLAVGTRSGKLVLVDAGSQACLAAAKVSESEAFVTPVPAGVCKVAMGVDEGRVTVWRWGEKSLVMEAETQVGAGVRSLVRAGSGVCALAGGDLVFVAGGAVVGRVACGDDVGPLAANLAGDVACVADAALVCVRRGGL